eukprot:29720-Pelagococcus_subviridis.AAC.1
MRDRGVRRGAARRRLRGVESAWVKRSVSRTSYRIGVHHANGVVWEAVSPPQFERATRLAAQDARAPRLRFLPRALSRHGLNAPRARAVGRRDALPVLGRGRDVRHLRRGRARVDFAFRVNAPPVERRARNLRASHLRQHPSFTLHVERVVGVEFPRAEARGVEAHQAMRARAVVTHLQRGAFFRFPRRARAPRRRARASRRSLPRVHRAREEQRSVRSARDAGDFPRA